MFCCILHFSVSDSRLLPHVKVVAMHPCGWLKAPPLSLWMNLCSVDLAICTRARNKIQKVKSKASEISRIPDHRLAISQPLTLFLPIQCPNCGFQCLQFPIFKEHLSQ